MRKQERDLEHLIAWAGTIGWVEVRRHKHIVLRHVSGAQYVLSKSPRGGEVTRQREMEKLTRIAASRALRACTRH